MRILSMFNQRLVIALAVAAGLAWPAVPAQAQQQAPSAAAFEALAAKVKHMEDVQAIQDLLIAYGRALDSRDFKAYAALFSKDGSWSGGMGTVNGGPQAIYDFMTSRIGGGRGGPPTIGWGSTYHIMSSFKIDVKGDSGTASSRWAFVTAARGPGIQVAGRYEDTLVREDGVWKFKSRQAFNDLPAPAAGTAGAGARSQTPPPAEGR